MSTQEDFEAKLADATITRIDGDPTMHSYDRMFEELRPWATKLKTDLFPQGDTYGFLAIICTDDEYGYFIKKDDYIFTMPEKPFDYDVNIPDGFGETQRKLREAIHRKKIIEYEKYLAVTAKLRKVIEEAVPEEYLEDIKDDVVGFDMLLPYDMLQHVRSKIALTTSDIDEMKSTVFITWDATESTLRKFINRMESGFKGCTRWKIVIPEQDLVQHLVKQVYASNIFEEKVMTDWENKRTILKTWTRAKEYFLKEASNKNNFSRATARQAGYRIP